MWIAHSLGIAYIRSRQPQYVLGLDVQARKAIIRPGSGCLKSPVDFVTFLQSIPISDKTQVQIGPNKAPCLACAELVPATWDLEPGIMLHNMLSAVDFCHA